MLRCSEARGRRAAEEAARGRGRAERGFRPEEASRRGRGAERRGRGRSRAEEATWGRGGRRAEEAAGRGRGRRAEETARGRRRGCSKKTRTAGWLGCAKAEPACRRRRGWCTKQTSCRGRGWSAKRRRGGRCTSEGERHLIAAIDELAMRYRASSVAASLASLAAAAPGLFASVLPDARSIVRNSARRASYRDLSTLDGSRPSAVPPGARTIQKTISDPPKIGKTRQRRSGECGSGTGAAAR